MAADAREAVALVVRLVARRAELAGPEALVRTADDRVHVAGATEGASRSEWSRAAGVVAVVAAAAP